MSLLIKIKNKLSGEYVTFDEKGKKVVGPEAKLDGFDKLKIYTPIYVLMGTAIADVYSYFNRTMEFGASALQKYNEFVNSPEVANKLNDIYGSYGFTELEYQTYDQMAKMSAFQPGGRYYGEIPNAYFDAKIEVTKYMQELEAQLLEIIGSAPDFVLNSMNTLEIGAVVGGVVIALAMYGTYRKDKRLKAEKQAIAQVEDADKLK